ncbi:MAG TPA: M20 family metallopeptidase [Thermomicrobiales bacterium]|nr:M20 family metallopeptidase [Thermomicrobiales bacterium]
MVFDSRITTYLQIARDRYIPELTRVCAIDSGSYHKAGIDQVQDHFQRRLTELGFEVERVRNAEWGDDLVARRRGTGKGRILLIGHADTVYPVGEAARRPVIVEGDHLLGPGTCDMKAGILTGIYAVEALNAIGWTNYELLTILIVSDEEIEQRHSVELLQTEGTAHDVVLTLEAARANGDIVTARKATRWFRIDAKGKAAHAGVEPEKGASATLALAHVIVEAFKLNGRKPGMTLNPGKISGGANPNIVAAEASVLVDIRAWTNQELEELSSDLRSIVETEWVRGVSQTMSLNGGAGMPAMERTPGTRRLEELAIGIASQLGFPLKGASTGGGSDVSIAVHAGAAGLDGLGPIGGLDHSPDEYIEVSSIVPRTALLAGLLQAICADDTLTRRGA